LLVSSWTRDAFLCGLLLSSLDGDRNARLTAVSHRFLPPIDDEREER
jgi:hypothetical protein